MPKTVEERLIFREVTEDDGTQWIDIAHEGDHQFENPANPSSTVYILALAIFSQFADGTIQKDIQNRYGFDLSHLIPTENA